MHFNTYFDCNTNVRKIITSIKLHNQKSGYIQLKNNFVL